MNPQNLAANHGRIAGDAPFLLRRGEVERKSDDDSEEPSNNCARREQ